MPHCPLCETLKDAAHAGRIRDFEHAVAFVNPEQDDYPGYGLLVLKTHHEHMHTLAPAVLHGFMDERARLAGAIMRAYPDVVRLNYANLGNMVSHVHEHLIPRRPGDHNAGAAPWPLGSLRRADEARLRAAAERVRRALG